MGLAICVGMLADLHSNDPEGAEWLQQGFSAANRLLQGLGLPLHNEPQTLPPLVSRAPLGGFPYSFIHYLRYAYAHRAASPTWIAAPLPDSVDPTKDSVVETAFEQFTSHLLCHSDAEGFYLPVYFQDVIFAAPEDQDLPGGMLGSSYILRNELILVAPALGIQLIDGDISDEEAKRIADIACSDVGLYRELSAWFALYEATHLSIQHKSAIVFS